MSFSIVFHLIKAGCLPEPGNLTSKLQEFCCLCLSSSGIEGEMHAAMLDFYMGRVCLNLSSCLHNSIFLPKSSPQLPTRVIF